LREAGGKVSPGRHAPMESAPVLVPVFRHPSYALLDNNRLIPTPEGSPDDAKTGEIRRAEGVRAEDAPEVLERLGSYIRSYLKACCAMEEVWIPGEDVACRCSILMSYGWEVAERLLIVMQNQVGSQLGIWSRGACLESGIQRGSMIPFVEAARREGFAVVILNPNANSVAHAGEDGAPRKAPISCSSCPEEHTLHVFDRFISCAMARKIALFGFGHGAILCKEILQVCWGV
jgi:hypothetical protein